MIERPLTESVAAELLAKYDQPGPRYTSYPTAVEFHEGFTAADYEARLAAAAGRTAEPLSLYVHLPFCAERCTFCGCNVIITRREGTSQVYLDHLAREIALVADRLGERRGVAQLHLGGGTPTYQSAGELRALVTAIGDRFEFRPDAERALEVDPRVTTGEQLETLAALGFNRLSMGVQDFAPEVQAAINRGQTYEQTESLVRRARELGFLSINVDLIYGLPRQTIESFRETIAKTIALSPDRVACYSYAHVPWIRGNQRRILPEDLPAPMTKFRLFGVAIEAFRAAGYEMIGMDHFAKPADELARAAKARRLHRNFMGYTTMPATDLVGFGVSAIGEVSGAYAQNTKKLSEYYEAIDAGRPPIAKGYVLTPDDRLRRDVIANLMCNFHVDKRAIEARHGIEFDAYFAPELAALSDPAAHGFVAVGPDAIQVTGAGRLFIRNVCMAFDAYLARKKGRRPIFSRTV